MSTTNTIGATQPLYTSLSSWWSAFAAGGWIGQCRAEGDGSGEFALTSSAFAMSGKSTSASDYAILTAYPGEGFRDNPGVQSAGFRYNKANGAAIHQTSAFASALNVSVDYVTVSNLQITTTGGGNSDSAYVNSQVTAPHCVLDSCILESSASANEAVRMQGGGHIYNSLIVARNAGARGISLSYASGSVIASCTVVCPSGITNAHGAIAVDNSGTTTILNTGMFGFASSATATGSGGTATLAGSNNASDQAIGFGSSNQASKAYSNQFAQNSNTLSDFKPKTGSDLVNNGVTDTTYITTALDAVGTSRPQDINWNIGAWELIPGSSDILMGQACL